MSWDWGWLSHRHGSEERAILAVAPLLLPAAGAPTPLTRIHGSFSPYEMPRSAATPFKEPANYEQALAELDRLVAQMEGGQLPLDQLLDGYRRGAELLNFCRARLQAVEEQVKVLDEGQLKVWAAE